MIRAYHEQDLNDLLDIWWEASVIAHPFLTEEFLTQERENIPNIYLPIAETWVYEKQGKVVGFIALLGNEVGAIFVHPDHQKVGIGRSLMDKAVALRGMVELEVFVDNPNGRAFYEHYGFVMLEQKHHEATQQQVLRLRFNGRDTNSN
ncbi:GNAT family N-acetyltransferase [Bremerella cremea]|uniref:GNAT family N-acetyltransferase n=1 Tax=Bremerella cremea TaxID=1031537 RepID=A0A368KKW1_9BACT|nr:GNAT family N-acetyltransferase [Bremerella cremea]RCS41411.1 GNAT family N-acetyltransferase [Bremerella cremea]